MIIVKLKGGLGNQMFQYAYGRLLSAARKETLMFDLSFFKKKHKSLGITACEFELNAFNITSKSAPIFLSMFVRRRLIYDTPIADMIKLKVVDDSTNADEVIYSDSKIIYLDGYFQSEKYFIPVKSNIRKYFSFTKTNNDSNILNDIRMQTNSVGVLVRRDDYVRDYHDQSLDIGYFKAAFSVIKNKINNPYFYVFTIGDESWSKQLYSIEKYIRIVYNKDLPDTGYYKMLLLSKCSHNIIPNSSYGWWSAWLNNNKKKIVIYPKEWGGGDPLNRQYSRCPKEWVGV